MTGDKVQILDNTVKTRKIEFNKYLTNDFWATFVEEHPELWCGFPTVTKESKGKEDVGIPVGHPKRVNYEFYIGNFTIHLVFRCDIYSRPGGLQTDHLLLQGLVRH